MERESHIISNIVTEERPLIGREEYPVSRRAADDGGILVAGPTALIDKSLARALAVRMHNNSAVADSSQFGSERPASAYFTLFEGEVFIEWGETDPSGESRLHDYLDREVNYVKRVKTGGVVRSGHIGRITLLGSQTSIRVALFDSLINGQTLIPTDSVYPIITTLLANNILPITSDGFPVQFSNFIKMF